MKTIIYTTLLMFMQLFLFCLTGKVTDKDLKLLLIHVMSDVSLAMVIISSLGE